MYHLVYHLVHTWTHLDSNIIAQFTRTTCALGSWIFICAMESVRWWNVFTENFSLRTLFTSKPFTWKYQVDTIKCDASRTLWLANTSNYRIALMDRSGRFGLILSEGAGDPRNRSEGYPLDTIYWILSSESIYGNSIIIKIIWQFGTIKSLLNLRISDESLCLSPLHCSLSGSDQLGHLNSQIGESSMKIATREEESRLTWKMFANLDIWNSLSLHNGDNLCLSLPNDTGRLVGLHWDSFDETPLRLLSRDSPVRNPQDYSLRILPLAEHEFSRIFCPKKIWQRHCLWAVYPTKSFDAAVDHQSFSY